MISLGLLIAVLCWSGGGVAPEAKVDDRLIGVLIKVESGGNDRAHGDRHLRQPAYGPLQIRQPVCDDVNRYYGTRYRASALRGNRRLSILICRRYLALHATRQALGRSPTAEDYARIWNGGPEGWKRRSTLGYWQKVRRQLIG